jgi:anti-anti-sigma factor
MYEDRPDLKDDGRNWRMKVGNSRLDDDALVFTGGGAVVGNIPSGLPGFSMPRLNTRIIFSLFPMAVIISLLGFMEAISIAKAMAARTGQRLDPNQELIGQGMANIAGSFFHSYAVSGSFSRSAVNIQAGAVSGLSNVFSSCVVVATLLFFTPLLYHLPQAVLAAIIMMAVIGLVNVRGFVHAWKAQKYDGAIGVITFITTLAFAPHLDRGIMIGVGLALILHLLRSMRPDIALLSLHPDGTFRNRARFNLSQCRHIALIRYNGSLYFANVNYLEEQILERISRMPDLKHIIIVGNGINEMDASGEDMLAILVSRIREAGYDISFSGLNDSVLDVLRRTHLYEKIGEDHLFRNATRAVDAVFSEAHAGSSEDPCPLRKVVTVKLPTILGDNK